MKSYVAVQAETLQVQKSAVWLADQGASGALVQFTGQVRDESGQVEALCLEHYPGMTEGILSTIVEQAGARWHLNGAWVVHRVGEIFVGEDIVHVAVSAAHRQAAFDACAYIMDFLKTRAPFWKKEKINGAWVWVEAKQSDEVAAAAWDD